MKKLIRYTLIFGLIFSMAFGARPTSSSSSGGSSSRPSSSGSSSYRSSGSSSGSGFGSSRPSYSTPSSSKPSSSGSSSWGSSSKPTTVQRQAAPTNSGSSYTAPKQSSADRALSDKINQSGSPSISRSQAVQQKSNAVNPPSSGVTVNNFNGNNSNRVNTGSSHTTTTITRYRYSSQPSIWPMGLPTTFLYMGLMHHIMWDSYYGGYGWYHGNRWYYYDDVYAAGPNTPVEGIPAQPGVRQGVVVVQRGFPWGWFFASLFFISALIALFWVVTRRRFENDDDEVVVETTTHHNYNVYSGTTPVERTSFKVAPDVKKNTMTGKLFGKNDITGVQPGDKVKLSDTLSVEDARTVEKNASALKVQVDSVTRIQEKDGFATWTFIRGTSQTNQELLISVKDVDNNRALAVYTRDIDGTRQALLDNDNKWLFAAPDSDNFNPMDLKYTQWFNRKLDGDIEDMYELKDQGELHGTATFNPTRSGQPELLATVAEYACGREQACNQYLVLELGNGDRSTVECWWGASLAANELALG